MSVYEDYSDEIIEAFAEAWASIDGKLEKFKAEKGRDYLEEDNSGTYVGYCAEARELLLRADSRLPFNLSQALSQPK